MTAHSNPILSSVIKLTAKMEGSKLSEEVLSEIDDSLTILSDFLEIGKTEALFFALVFSLQNKENSNVTLRKIADFLQYPFLNILEYRFVFDTLENKGLLFMSERKNVSHHPENNGYMIPGSILNNVIDGKPIIVTPQKSLSLEDCISEIMFIGKCFQDNVMNEIEYIRQVILFEQKSNYIELIKNITDKFPSDFESRMILYYFCYSLIFGDEILEPVWLRQDYETGVFGFLSNSSRAIRRRDMFCRNDVLIKEGFIEKNRIENVPRYGTILSFSLTNKGIISLFGKDSEKYELQEEVTELDRIIIGLNEIACIYEQKLATVTKLVKLKTIESEFIKYDYFKELKHLISNASLRFIYYDCVNDFVNGNESSLTHTLQDILGRGNKYFSELRSFLDEKNYLVDNGFLEINKNDIVDKTTITLTDKSIELLYGKNADLYKKKTTSANILIPENLKEKTLFYSDSVQSQINMLEDSLVQEKLTAIQNRLDSKGLPKGVAVILYGASGTGKTETVYQLAKKTNRKVLHVDISESKSMWFGESEKRIKKIFTDYRSLCKSCKHHGENTPILLFNEADALISKRNTLEGGGPRQTENAIQNILLEEMENLDGLMIATTNLCENMDAAFERRFLFKIKYEKPSIEARSKIWMNKLNYISEKDSIALAESFDFSGGEIDNIVRKCEMDEIITGIQPSYDRLVELCKDERLEKVSERRMGFVC